MNKNDNLFQSSTLSSMPSVDIKIEATHAGFVNGNNVLYTEDGMSGSTHLWIEPFSKPVLTHHNSLSDAIGRVTDARYLSTPLTIQDRSASSKPNKPKGYIELTARITDPGAMPKVKDKRYSTVSISGSTNKVRCGICDHDIANKGPCPSHKKGKVYDDKKAFWVIDGMSYSEVSFVNVPADTHAKVTEIIVNDSTKGSSKQVKTQDSKTKKEDKANQKGERTMVKRIILTADDLKFFNDLLVGDTSFDHFVDLPDSVFAGPSRTFIASDSVSVKNSLAKLSQARGLSPATRSRVRASLVRKAKKYGVQVDRKDEELARQISLKDPWTDTQKQEAKSAWEEIEERDAKLTSAARKKLPNSAFCGPSRSFPAHDRSHAVNALVRVKQFGSSALQTRIKACVCQKFSSLPSCKRGGSSDYKDIDITKSWSDELIAEIVEIDKRYPEDAKMTREYVKNLPDTCFSGPNRTFLSVDTKTATSSLVRLKTHGSSKLSKLVAADIHDKFPDLDFGDLKVEDLEKVEEHKTWEPSLIEESLKIEKEHGPAYFSDQPAKVNYDSMISNLDQVKAAKDFLDKYEGTVNKESIKSFLDSKENEFKESKEEPKNKPTGSQDGVKDDNDGDADMTLEEMLKSQEMIAHLDTINTEYETKIDDLKVTITEGKATTRDLENQVSGLMEDNTDLRDKAHVAIVDRFINAKLKLKKKDVIGLDEKGLQDYKDKMLERTRESLQDALYDLESELGTSQTKDKVESDGVARKDNTNKQNVSDTKDTKKSKSASEIIFGK